MSRKRVAILISGGGSNMEALLADMEDPAHPARPALVLSNNAEAGGLAKAAARGVATEIVDHRPFGEDRPAFDAAVHAKLEAAGAEIVCLAGFMRVLTPGFMDIWRGRILNTHPSLLPLYRGLHTHERALAAGDVEHGCSVHEATAELDEGPILGQARVPVKADDTPGTLAARVLNTEHRLYPAVLRRFAVGDRTRIDLA